MIMTENLFPQKPELKPIIYAYTDSNPTLAGFIKVGYTAKNAKERVAEQYPTNRPGKLPYQILLEEAAIKRDGSFFKDYDVHQYLRKKGIKKMSPGYSSDSFEL